jgi:ABC-type dipeptide/oligopeptide/nickel transport system permease subunit
MPGWIRGSGLASQSSRLAGEGRAAKRRARAETLRRFAKDRVALASCVFLVTVVIAVLAAPLITAYRFDAIAPVDSLQPPGATHLMGTDIFGRDIFTRVLYGGRLSLVIGLSATAVGGIGGSLVGVVAGYFGGMIDDVLMRIVDMMLAFPGVLLAMGIVAMLGPNIVNLIVAVGVGGVPGFARLMRSTALSIRSSDYVLAAKASGCSSWWIIRRHVLLNSRASFITFATLSVSTAILYAAALGYLGLGSKPPSPEWGQMVSDGSDLLGTAWWVSFFPGLAILLSALAINLVGDGLNALASRSRAGR